MLRQWIFACGLAALSLLPGLAWADPSAVVSVAVPADGRYGVGRNLDFTVTWDQDVVVTGTPRLALTIGATTVQAVYMASPTPTTTLFRYAVLQGQTDADGIAVGALTLNGGTIQSAGNVDADLTLNSVGATAGVLVETVAPTLPAANIVVDNQGNPHRVVLTFSEDLDAATLGPPGQWTVTSDGGNLAYTVAAVGIAFGRIVTLTLAGVSLDDPATFITNGAATAHLDVIPPALLRDVAGNAYVADLVTEAGATHLLDSMAPVFTGVGAGNATASGGSLFATPSEIVRGRWIAVAQGAPAPSAAQVLVGVDYGAVTVLAAGGGVLPALAPATLALAGLPAGTALTLYLAGVDAAGNLSASPVSADLGTLANPGACGSAADVASAFAPSAGLCSAGTASSVAAGAAAWGWSCTTPAASASCTAPQPATATQSGTAFAVPAADNGWVLDAANSAGFIGLSGDAKSPSIAPPAGLAFPHGLLDFRLVNGTPGSVASMTITYPAPLPAGTAYWKFGPEPGQATPHWYRFGGAVLSPDRRSITLSIQDGAQGDGDLPTPSSIVDPGGPAVPQGAQPIPALSPWATLLAGGGMALAAAAALRRRRGASARRG